MSFVDEVVAREVAKAQAHRYSLMLDRQGQNVQQLNPNAGIPQQYTQQSGAQPSGGLMGMNSLMPMRAFREMYGRQGSPAQMQQNRQDYQGQYGPADSLAPMQSLNQYRQSNTTQTAPNSGTTPVSGGK